MTDTRLGEHLHAAREGTLKLPQYYGTVAHCNEILKPFNVELEAHPCANFDLVRCLNGNHWQGETDSCLDAGLGSMEIIKGSVYKA
ncbi:hypothetical protein CY34DRAFT_806419 [Suillus luteus UH-Slu-Lm8-n1]|uniref:Uncharacterized protein n=1 Tax=Suillus luteus UH-Slu-Lm8-n1 TaxID=930992 RepID=A0A0D0B3U9_9AGAM|nr:hypothetical protein CY34DRAFT_806419 [Suillus luteus UH-Slu-Lm8-n1]